MGQILARIFDRLASSFGPKECKILMLGLDAAGKTTVLYQLKLPGQKTSTIPTIGFCVETVNYKNVNFTLWDVGGQNKIRSIWRQYYLGTQGLIYVVDSADRERADEAKTELHNMLKDERLATVQVLVLANKSDLRRAMSEEELTEKLELTSLTNTWFVQRCCAKTGEGLLEGLEWMSNSIQL